MPLGTVKKLLPDKHFGFIAPSQGGVDVFFHGSTVAGDQFGTLILGQRVEYEIAGADDIDRGPRASKVRPLHGVVPLEPHRSTEFRMLRRHPSSRAKKPTWRKKAD